ncbi:MAG: hypothetical protein QXU32_13305 [Nitrososphaerales archaeon]
MDWRFFVSGVGMMATGIVVAVVFGALLTSGPLDEFNQNRAIAQIGGIIIGIGFLITLVSFGFSRRKKGGVGKDMPAKTDDSN